MKLNLKKLTCFSMPIHNEPLFCGIKRKRYGCQDSNESPNLPDIFSLMGLMKQKDSFAFSREKVLSLCDICKKKFYSKKSLANHRRWHDLPEYKEFQDKFKKRMNGKNHPMYGKHHSHESKIRNSESTRKYTINEKFFNNINTEEKAYWLGFLYGDGCVYPKRGNIQLGLQLKDKKHLEKFKKSIESKHKITIRKKKNMAILNIYSYQMIIDLIKFGCVPQKSHKLIHIPNIPIKLIRHFIRGLFDADGCIGIYKDSRYNSKSIRIDLCGHKPFIKNINDFLVNNQIFDHYNKLSYHTKRTVSMIYAGKHAKSFLNYIYDKSSIYLDRKHEIYQRGINN